MTLAPLRAAPHRLPAHTLLRPLSAVALGWMLALAGMHASAVLAALGLALAALGYGALALRFLALMRQSRVPDRHHARVVTLGNAALLLGWSVAALAIAFGHDAWARAAAWFGLWSGAGVIFVGVSHRMIPFFTAAAVPALDAWRPWVLLAALVALVGGLGPWAAADALVAPAAWPPALLWLRVAIETLGSAGLLWLALRWGLVQSLRIRLLAMLHTGFFWLGLALLMAATSHALMALTRGALSLGLAPLHAFTMGYLGSTLMAMATRVMCGHGARPLVADDAAWALFWLLQAAVWCRRVAAQWPRAQVPFTLLAAALWLAAMAGWALREGRTLLRRPEPPARAADRPQAPLPIVRHGRLPGSTGGATR